MLGSIKPRYAINIRELLTIMEDMANRADGLVATILNCRLR